jgi:hypothetical protein
MSATVKTEIGLNTFPDLYYDSACAPGADEGFKPGEGGFCGEEHA